MLGVLEEYQQRAAILSHLQVQLGTCVFVDVLPGVVALLAHAQRLGNVC